MNPSPFSATVAPSPGTDSSRLDYLDATRAFALVLGIVFHACLSFTPFFVGWAVQDVSTSPLVSLFMTVSHSFRMATFFLLAGFLSHLTFHRKAAGEFVRSRLLRIGVPFVVGWFILHPLVVSGWIMGSASLRGPVDILAGLRGGFQSLSNLPQGLFVGSHLWFLYYLALVTALTLTGRALVRITGPWGALIMRRADAAVGWLAKSPVAPVLLALPTAAALWFMRFWGMDTPDQSLVPQLPPLLIYGSFFLLGWMLHRQGEMISQITRLTLPRWIMAGLGLTAVLLLGDLQGDPGHPHYLAAHVAHAVGYALSMWSLAFLTIGVFRKLFARPNAFVRYVADSSYWMYLFHLPVVVWLQVAVAELPLNWSLKLAFISLVTIGLSLVTYDLFVRSTWVGRVLNGRRQERVLAPWLPNRLGRLGYGKPSGTLKSGAVL
ncbi:MAG TPA: acyltransferase family protein [Candidatus Limnocylindria bacterium]|jgi:peptidoglycan/LPS O-acetylase OafA/YrhL|nr:acyltransferase family protein [Candidatus Limnocylindria bacterium]